MTTGKTISLTRWTFVGKVMSLLFNMLSRLLIAFLPRSKWLLIPWLQSPFAVILEPPKIKSVTVSTIYPSICHKVMGLDAMILVFWMLPLDESESGEWKSWLKAQNSENEDHGIWFHHFMASRCGHSEKLYFLGLHNHCRWWLQPWNLKRRLLLGRKVMTNLSSIL